MPEIVKPGNPTVAPARSAETFAGIAIFRDLALDVLAAPSAPALAACCNDSVPGSGHPAAERQALVCHWSLISAWRLECRWQRAGSAARLSTLIRM
jgi:hypothetical protein